MQPLIILVALFRYKCLDFRQENNSTPGVLINEIWYWNLHNISYCQENITVIGKSVNCPSLHETSADYLFMGNTPDHLMLPINTATMIYGYIDILRCKLSCGFQRWLWQLGTGQANYSFQSTPKKKCTKSLEYTQEYNQLLKMIVRINKDSYVAT